MHSWYCPLINCLRASSTSAPFPQTGIKNRRQRSPTGYKDALARFRTAWNMARGMMVCSLQSTNAQLPENSGGASPVLSADSLNAGDPDLLKHVPVRDKGG